MLRGNKKDGSIGYRLNGWSREGLEVFNKLASKVALDRRARGEEFGKQFHEAMMQQVAAKTKSGRKRKLDVLTYNDLSGEQQDGDPSEDEEDTLIFAV